MRSKNTGFIIGFLLFCLSLLLSCSTDQAPFAKESGLPESELAYYSDSFDSFKRDLWEKGGLVKLEDQLENLRIADMTFEDGRLRIDTKTGGFSEGTLVSKFALRGDYDVQIDFQIKFVAGEFDMDQVLGLGAWEKSKSGKSNRWITIGLLKKGNDKERRIFCGYYLQGDQFYHTGFTRQIDNFNGSVRLVRSGNQVSTFFRKKWQIRWTKMCNIWSDQNDVLIVFQLANYILIRKSIMANRSITAWIDNFKINAAQEIIESEI